MKPNEIRTEAQILLGQLKLITGPIDHYDENVAMIISLCERVRAETEAVVTKRERERARLLFAVVNGSLCVCRCRFIPLTALKTWTCERCKALAAYESNDAGESRG